MKTNQYALYTICLFAISFLSSCSQSNTHHVEEGYIYIQDEGRSQNEKAWELVWEEKFNTQRLDTSLWSRIGLFTTLGVKQENWRDIKHCFRYITATDSRVVDFDEENIYLNGIINPDSLTADPRPYLTGGISSKGKFAFQYGRIEIKAKLDQAYGMWPAIWMLSEKDIYPDQHNGEMDIMEKLNHDDFAYQTTHNHYTIHLNGQLPKKDGTAPIDTLGYNVYSVSWTPQELRYAVNGQTSYVYPKVDSLGTHQWPFDQPFYLMIDQQMEHVWPGKITKPEELPISMIVDWVRLYQ